MAIMENLKVMAERDYPGANKMYTALVGYEDGRGEEVKVIARNQVEAVENIYNHYYEVYGSELTIQIDPGEEINKVHVVGGDLGIGSYLNTNWDYLKFLEKEIGERPEVKKKWDERWRGTPDNLAPVLPSPAPDTETPHVKADPVPTAMFEMPPWGSPI